MKRLSPLLRYGLATLAVALVLLLKLLLDPLITEQSPFLMLAGAVMVGAWFGGLGPGLLATALGALAADYFFLPPRGSFTGLGEGFLPLALFMVQGVLISSLTEALRLARGRAEAGALEARSHQERLRRSEERFRLLVEGVEDYAIFMLDPEGYVASWNAGAERINGYRQEEIIGEHFSVFYTQEDTRRAHPEEELLVAASEGRYQEEGSRVRKDGSIFWASVLITALRDEEGNLRGFSKVVRDITERKESEAALQESERRFRALVQNSSDVITVVDAEGIIRYVSPAVERVMGYRPEELVGKSVFDHVHPEDLEQGRSAFAGIWSQPGIHPPFEFRVPHKDGSWRQSEFILNNLLDDPSVRGVVINQRDITERKEAEEALSQSEERYRAVVKQSAEGLYLVDGVTKRILETNSALQNMLGYKAEELRGIELHEIVAHDRASVEANIERTLEEGKRFIRERMYRRKDGSVVEVEIAASAIDYGGKQVICAAIRDITERREAAEQLRESEELHRKVDARLYEELAERERELHDLVGRMMATQEEERRRVAYEVHDGFTQMAAAAYRRLALFAEHHPPESARDREELEEAIALVRRTVGEARRVIANLRPTTLDDFGLATAIRMQVEELRTEGYETTYEETLGEARLPTTLETALFRLAQEALTNVRKHAQTERVRVALELRDRTVRLEVSDQGRGFAPAEAKQGAGPGERVGLSSMRERIALLGGRFEIRSEPGTGTSVVAEVPLKATGEEVDGGE